MRPKAQRHGIAGSGARKGLLCSLLVITPLPLWAGTNHLEKSLELLSQGDLTAAEKEARLALSDPSSPALAWAALGTIRFRQFNYEESEKFLNTALQLNPQLVSARISLGIVYVQLGKTDQARDLFKGILKTDPGNFNARFDLAKLDAQSANYRDSLEVAGPVISALRNFDEGVLVLATDYLGLQQLGPARAVVSDWKELSTIDQDVAVDLASLLMRTNLVDEAIEVLEKAKQNRQVTYRLAYTLANSYLSKGDVKQASAHYELALGLEENCVSCLVGIAKIAEQEGNSEKALAYLIKARQAEPENPEILFEFGKVCLERDLMEDAIPSLQHAVELQPDNASYTYVLSSAYIGKSRYRDAQGLLESLLVKRPDDAILNYTMGAVLYLEVSLEDSTRYLKKSISVQPDQIAAYYYLGLVAERKEELDEAAEIFRDLLRRYPDHEHSCEELGSILLKQRKYEEAQSILEKAVRLDPNSAKAHYQLGILLARAGKDDESRKHREIAQKIEADGRKKSETDLRILMPQ